MSYLHIIPNANMAILTSYVVVMTSASVGLLVFSYEILCDS
jgi:hypothetical protein